MGSRGEDILTHGSSALWVYIENMIYPRSPIKSKQTPKLVD